MSDIERIKNNILPILQRNDIDFAALFGSYARNQARGDSDVDLLVRFNSPKSLFEISDIERILAQALGKDVDLVTEKSLSPYIKEDVLRESVVIYEKE